MNIIKTALFVSITAATAPSLLAYEKIYASTAPGKIEIKILPARTVMEASGEGSYFQKGNKMFGTLFRHIKREDIKMTVPVEADPSPATMRFYAGKDTAGRSIEGSRAVAVKKLPEQRVLSVGVQGSYSEKNYEYVLKKANAWLANHPEWKADGAPYMVYWNSPFVPGMFKKSELHLYLVQNPDQDKEKAARK